MNEPSKTGEVAILQEDAATPDARLLIQHLDAELRERYPQDAIHGVDFRQLADGRGAFFVARLAGRAVGCGAVRLLEQSIGEVKRMFVERAFRGRGIARAILRALESAAVELGFHTLRLETGVNQPEAIRLYESAGYLHIPRYGVYASDLHSVCFEKRLERQP